LTAKLSNVKVGNSWYAHCFLVINGSVAGALPSKFRGKIATPQLSHSRTTGGYLSMYQTNPEFTTKGEEPIQNRKSLSLSLAGKGSRLRIISVPEGRDRTQLIRLGIMNGEVVRCIERLPGGTIVIEKNRQEIAIGASLARTMMVDSAG
jgi:Fe2+ transport system protein FeoA